MPIRAIVFDLFDTLVDLRLEDFPQVEFRNRRFAASLGVLHELVGRFAEVDFDHFGDTLFDVDRGLRDRFYAADVEVPSIDRFRALALRLGIEAPELPDLLTETHMRMFRENSPAPAHHAALLERLRARVKLGLCSNFTHAQTAHAVLEQTGLAAHLDATVISETFGWRKPKRDIFERVLGDLDVGPHEAIHVGDSLKADVGGASALGIRTVWVTRRVKDPAKALADHPGPKPDHQIADLAEVVEFLDAT